MAPFPGTLVRKMDGGRYRDGRGFGPFVNDPGLPWGLVVHTTETAWVPGYVPSGKSYSVAPHFTYDHSTRTFYQHVELDRRAGTLSGSSTKEGGKAVPTNAAKVIQIEIIAYSAKSVVDKYGGKRIWVRDLPESALRDLADLILWLHEEKGIDLSWYPKRSTTRAAPMSHDEWLDRAWGICEHASAPDDSTHFDAGAIRSDRIMALVHDSQKETNQVTRLAGPDRYATAAAVSRHLFPNGSDTVWVATGENFPDALAAAVAGEPLLLTARDSLPTATAAEIVRLGASHAYIVGEADTVSDSVAAEINRLLRVA